MQLCLIIDGYSTGGQYAEILANMDYKCLHLQSSQDLPNFITNELEKERYLDCKIHRELSDTLHWIGSYGEPKFILPGSDSSVVLADNLSHYLNLKKSNSCHLSLARRDKFIMGETIKANGIRSIKQIKTNQADKILLWMKENNISWPIVVKPLKSGSAEGFSLCQNFEAVQETFSKLIHSKDLFNQTNDELLVQEYIAGTEYVVNTVSKQGKHVVSEYCIYNKIINQEGNSLYKSTRYLSRKFQHSSLLEKYIFSVLDALDIQYGPVHAEVMLDEQGPVLIEIGARPAGANMNRSLLHHSYGHTQVDLSVLAYVSPDDFDKVIQTLSYSLREELATIYLMSDKNGVINEINLDKFERLSSFKKIELYLKVGDYVNKAKNLEDIIGIVYLQHKENHIIEKDILYLENINPKDYVDISEKLD